MYHEVYWISLLKFYFFNIQNLRKYLGKKITIEQIQIMYFYIQNKKCIKKIYNK